jgi:hypothetical protein
MVRVCVVMNSLHFLLVSDVPYNGNDLASDVFAIDLRDLVKLLFCPSHNIDFGPVHSERLCAHQADPRSSSRDEGNLVLDWEHLTELHAAVVRRHVVM